MASIKMGAILKESESKKP